MKRVKWIALILVLAVVTYLGAAGVVCLTRPTPGLTVENARLLRRGMTLEQVEELFGCAGYCIFTEPNSGEACKVYVWSNELGPNVWIQFDAARQVTWSSFLFGRDPINVDESVLEWLRRMLRL